MVCTFTAACPNLSPYLPAINHHEKTVCHLCRPHLCLHRLSAIFSRKVPLSINYQGKEKYRMYRLFNAENKTLTLNLSEGQELLLKGYEGELDLEIIKE